MKLGEKTGRMEGHLLYQTLEQEGSLFLMKTRIASTAVTEKIGNRQLIQSTGLDANGRLQFMIDEVVRVSQQKGFKDVYLAWDPIRTPLATVLSERYPIQSVSTLSAGLHADPLAVAKIVLP